MLRFLIYLFPAMMDVILGVMFFITIDRFVQSGASAFKVSLAVPIWAIIYSTFSFLIGRVVTPRNAAAMLSGAGALVGLTCLSFVLFPAIDLQYLWIFIIGVGTACFFCPFQVFMKAAESGEDAGVVRSTSLYTFSWSAGMASGPLLAGIVWGKYFPENGWKYCYLISMGLCAIIAIGIWPLKKQCEKPQRLLQPTPKKTSRVRTDYSNMPDLAWLGWLAAGVGCVSVAIIRSLFQYKADPLHIPKADQGGILALLSYIQAFTGLCLINSRYWMYRILPVTLFSACGIIGLLLFGLGTTTFSFYIAATAYGIYSGGFFFYLVFHSLVHPEHSAKYVSINEIVVGLTGVFGPIAGGVIADYTNSNVPFLLSGLLIIAVVAIQFIVKRKHLELLGEKNNTMPLV